MTEIWLIPTDTGPEQARALLALLDPAERARARSAPAGPQRHRFITAHAAARLLTAAAAGLPPERIRWRHGPHGRPEPDGLDGRLSVNLSTAGPWALFAVERRPADGGAIGVDLEPVPTVEAAARLARRYYPEAETTGDAEEFTLRWTRKEAYTKARGGRLADGLRTPAGPTGTPGPHRLYGPLGPCTVRDLPAPPGHRAALARTGTRPLPPPNLRRYPIDAPELLARPDAPDLFGRAADGELVHRAREGEQLGRADAAELFGAREQSDRAAPRVLVAARDSGAPQPCTDPPGRAAGAGPGGAHRSFAVRRP
ncbi:4'-phosphopantetheinyl transferase superfamily protein [Streptomyces sp. TLI_171]|uniref:4'-phosphopantetheinyl transferase family protein n=1 Tax=Streptomyces sp. TLI_171 TaxID=1938859 RepID=UPI000C63BCF1|nr:4'-phosphopantetheinyl transferase superfamily protein [Streptomyces sp. TLI_171]RKE22673.1 phosphopantetheinyl transferase [Streptomyces sp. TLI_171]